MNRIQATQCAIVLAAIFVVAALPREALAAKQYVARSSSRAVAPVSSEVPYRQCSGVFFSTETSAWFTMDCLVPADYAQVGVLTTGLLPGVGKKKLWITDVYAQPKLTPTPTAPEPPKPADADNDVPPAADQAVIDLVMPPGAKLFVNDVAVEVGEGHHEVAVAGLEREATYEYRLRLEPDAEADAPGSERTIAFAAGARVLVDLTAAAQADKAIAADETIASHIE